MTKFKVVHLGASAAAEILPGGVLLVVFGGLVTAHALAELKRPISARLGAAAHAVLADYRQATLVMDSDDLRLMMAGEDRDNLPGLPAAVLCSEEYQWVLKAHAVAAADIYARYRIVTSDAGEAMRWVMALAAENLAAMAGRP